MPAAEVVKPLIADMARSYSNLNPDWLQKIRSRDFSRAGLCCRLRAIAHVRLKLRLHLF